jgi:hypothetical protein
MLPCAMKEYHTARTCYSTMPESPIDLIALVAVVTAAVLALWV